MIVTPPLDEPAYTLRYDQSYRLSDIRQQEGPRCPEVPLPKKQVSLVRYWPESPAQECGTVEQMLADLRGLKYAHLENSGIRVRQDAIEELAACVRESWSTLPNPPKGDVGADGSGGAEIVWEEGDKALILSAAASVPELNPDVYLLVIDRRQSDRNKKYKTIRPDAGNESFAKELSEHLKWLMNPAV